MNRVQQRSDNPQQPERQDDLYKIDVRYTRFVVSRHTAIDMSTL